MNWQPIETAPDGEQILVSYRFHGVSRPGQVAIKECADGQFIWPSKFYEATHWMPLPDPPSLTSNPKGERDPNTQMRGM